MTKLVLPHKHHNPLMPPTRLLRKCHLRKLYQRRRAVGWTPPKPSRRLKDWQIDALDKILPPGFAQWYGTTHDELGYTLPHVKSDWGMR